MHRLNDIPPYPPPMDYIAVLPLSACPVYHAIVIPSHVLNIITIMITLKTMSLYLNVISPHRATTFKKKAVSPEAAFFTFNVPLGQEKVRNFPATAESFKAWTAPFQIIPLLI